MRFSKKFFMMSLFVGAALLVMSAAPARADLRLTLDSVTSVSGGFDYTYSVNLAPNSTLDAGGGMSDNMNGTPKNFLVLYDVNGLVSGSVTLSATLTALFAESVQNLGPQPVGVNPVTDSPNVPNILLTYTSGTDTSNPGVTNLLLGTFSFVSTNALGNGNTLDYGGASQAANDNTAIANNISQIGGPGTTAPPVPEPASLVLALAGLPALALLRRRRKIA